MSILIPALVLASIAVAILLWVATTIYKAVPFRPNQMGEKWKLAKRQKAFEAAEASLQKGSAGQIPQEALPLFLESFCIETTFEEMEVIGALHQHHQALVGRLIELCSHNSQDLQALEVVEDLLVDRDGLLREYADTKRARSDVTRKQKEKGRSPPDWALSEFNKKILDLDDRLKTNAKSLQSKLTELFKTLGNARPSSEVVYH